MTALGREPPSEPGTKRMICTTRSPADARFDRVAPGVPAAATDASGGLRSGSGEASSRALSKAELRSDELGQRKGSSVTLALCLIGR